MKNLMKILSLLLCFELIVGPLNISLLTADIAHAEETTCPTGQTFNTSVNRCLTSAEVIRVNNATQSCGTDQACYQRNAEAELLKSVNDEEVGSHDNFFGDDKGNTKNWTKALNAGAIAIPLFFLIQTMINSAQVKKVDKDFRCRPPSLMLMFGAAAILGSGEVITHFTHKAALKKMEERWSELVVPDTTAGKDDQKAQATEAQSQAFEFLAQNEDSVAKTAKTKHAYYAAASGIFAAGTLMAGVELIQLRAAKIKAASTEPATQLEGRREIARLTCGSQLDKEKDDKRREDIAKEEEADKKKEDEKEKKKAEKEKKKTEKKSGDTGSSFIKRELEINKAKTIAAKNISTAKNVEDLLQLTQEFHAIEFENYSKVSYFDEGIKSYQEVKLGSDIAGILSNIFLDEANAQSDDDTQLHHQDTFNGLDNKTMEKLKNIDSAAKVQKENKEKEVNTEASKEKETPGTKELTGVGAALKGVSKFFKFQNGVPLSKEALDQIEDKMNTGYKKFIYSPWTRLGINTLLGTWMGIMSHHMKLQKETSEARAKKLREIKTEFASANGLMNCKSEDRDDPSKPKCYCFTADNKPNPARGSSKICATNFAELNTGVNGNNITTLKTCVDENFNTDPKCGCKNKKGSDGKNACLKATSGINFKGFNPGTFRMLSAGAGPGNDILNGNLAAGSMDSASVSANAAKIRAATNDMLKKIDPNLGNQIKGISAGMEKSLLATGSGLSMPGLANNAALPSSPKEAAKALEKEMKEETAPEVTKAGGDSASPSSGGEAQPEFGLTEEQLAAQESEIAEVMGQEMDMGNNDINSGEKTNLFDVLSNRYKRSGMRRLFDEEGKTKADAPSKSDVAP